jgi:hypothetical protein
MAMPMCNNLASPVDAMLIVCGNAEDFRCTAKLKS